MSSNLPPEGQPEYLGTGDPAPAPRRGRRNALIAGGVVGAVAVVGGGAWAASWYLGSGPSTSGVLPSATVAYVEVNLDPSGAQKIAALDTLNKFPAFADEVGIGSRDDLRQKLFESVQDDSGCADLDYDADIKPWLGDRAAFAAVDEGADEPTPVAVLEVTDEDQADAGLKKLASCGGGDTGFVVSDGWAVVAETKTEAQKVLDLADKGTLADDDDYQTLTAAAGSTGVATAYVAPGAGDVLSDLIASGSVASGESLPPSTTKALEDFGGLAVQVRFDGGGVEVETAGRDTKGTTSDTLATGGVEAVTGLPEGTGAALGVALKPGWGDQAFTSIVDNLSSIDSGLSRDDLVAEVEQATGLTVPDDLETLLGSSAALSVSGDLDVDQIVNSSDASSLPVGLRVIGDADKVEGVLDKLRTASGQAAILQSTSDGDRIAVGPDSDYNGDLVAAGSLGDSSTFKAVVPDASKAASILYLDADANDGWLVKALTGLGVPSDITDNVEPIKAFGAEGWVEDGLTHGQLTITTN